MKRTIVPAYASASSYTARPRGSPPVPTPCTRTSSSTATYAYHSPSLSHTKQLILP